MTVLVYVHDLLRHSLSGALAVLELTLDQADLRFPPECWDLSRASPHPACRYLLLKSHRSTEFLLRINDYDQYNENGVFNITVHQGIIEELVADFPD